MCSDCCPILIHVVSLEVLDNLVNWKNERTNLKQLTRLIYVYSRDKIHKT